MRYLTQSLGVLAAMLFCVCSATHASTVTRSASGVPGSEYWQQRVDYEIKTSLNPESHSLRSTARITYTNNSPDELHYIWLHLEQNIFVPGSYGAISHPIKGSEVSTFKGAGFVLDELSILEDGKASTPDTFIDGTRMRIDLRRALPGNGSTVTIEMAWSFVIPIDGLGRMGREETKNGWVYALGQWFPRVAVYDDIQGWNPDRYMPWDNFYLDYGKYDVEITVPAGMTVVGTGVLENADEVLAAPQLRRLARARKSAKRVYIIEPDEVASNLTRYDATKPRTWKFSATDVRDFAWAASTAFIWDAASWENTLIASVYPVEAVGNEDSPGWESITELARSSISFYSGRYSNYHYPQLTNIASADGQEYPMLHFSPIAARGDKLFNTVGHEIAHMWFPMLVGTNERHDPWMDEGMAAHMDYYLQKFMFNRLLWSRRAMSSAETIANAMQETYALQPIATPAEALRGPDIGESKSFLHYRKAGYGLVLLREVILGPDRFDIALRQFIEDWSNKHPRAEDFFQSIENSSGEDLEWFWQGWLSTAELIDQEIVSVAVESGGTRVQLQNTGGLQMPVDLRIQFETGEEQRIKLPVLFWSAGDQSSILIDRIEDVKLVEIDPDHYLPDTNRDNNYWVSERSRPLN